MKKENNERLWALMGKYILSCGDVAKLLGAKTHTIYNWRSGRVKFKKVNEYACLHKLQEKYKKNSEQVENDIKSLDF